MLVYAKKTEKGLAIKKKLVEALNESKVFSNDENGTATIEDDLDEIPIPKSSFDTDDIPIPKSSFDTGDVKIEVKNEPEELLATDIRLGIPIKSGDGTITGYAEFSNQDKLESISGLRDGDVLAFATGPEEEFEIAIMTDDDGEEE